MKKLSRKKVIELLQTGDFTIGYHDEGDCEIYKGRHNYEDLIDSVYSPVNNYGGSYLPEIVYLLTEALTGKTEPIKDKPMKALVNTHETISIKIVPHD